MRDKKQEERKKAIERVGAMSPAARREAERAIAGRLAGLGRAREARSVMLYVSCGHEVDTRVIIKDLLAAGKRLAVGRCRPAENGLDAVAIGDLGRDTVPGYAGIPEPREGLEVLAPDELDLVVVPLAAFGADCRRLGRGKGFYDRFLTRVKSGCLKVGLAFECQKSEELPEEGHDVKLDMVLTENGIYENKQRN